MTTPRNATFDRYPSTFQPHPGRKTRGPSTHAIKMGLFKTLYTGGGTAQNWLTLRNGDHLTGLFRGMFEKNTLTFNSGCDRHARPVEGFTDVREPQRQGVRLTVEADEATAAPTHGMALDQGGNPVLVDPHR